MPDNDLLVMPDLIGHLLPPVMPDLIGHLSFECGQQLPLAELQSPSAPSGPFHRYLRPRYARTRYRRTPTPFPCPGVGTSARGKLLHRKAYKMFQIIEHLFWVNGKFLPQILPVGVDAFH